MATPTCYLQPRLLPSGDLRFTPKRYPSVELSKRRPTPRLRLKPSHTERDDDSTTPTGASVVKEKDLRFRSRITASQQPRQPRRRQFTLPFAIRCFSPRFGRRVRRRLRLKEISLEDPAATAAAPTIRLSGGLLSPRGDLRTERGRPVPAQQTSISGKTKEGRG